jgi:hypothetical protein
VFARTEQCHQAISGRSQKLFLESQNHGIWRESESQLPFFRSLLGLAFKTHADKDMNTDLLQQVLFADYRTVNGVQVPFHIQRLQNGGLLLDLTLTSASFNSGVLDTTFSLQ